jgi:hypothetical protein
VVGREFRGREEVKKKTPTSREDVHPQNGLNGLIVYWCIGGCWFIPAVDCLDGVGGLLLLVSHV